MTTALMPVPKQQYFDAVGVPLVGGKVYTYAAGTNTPKQTFTDAAGTIPQANPIILNARGEPASAIFWQGSYKVEIRDFLDNLIYTVDNYNSDPNGLGSFLTDIANTSDLSKGAAMIGRNGQVVTSISALRNLLKTSPSKYAFVTGYYASGDGGGGSYYLDVADVTTADNGGTVIVAGDGGRWKLYGQNGWVSIKQFGAKMDDATDDSVAIQAAVTWILSQTAGGAVYIPRGIARIGTGIVIPNTANKSFVLFGDGPMSQIRPTVAITMFTVGDATPQFGSNRILRDFAVAQATVANVNAITLYNANSTTIERVYFANVNNAIVLQSSYNTHIDKCQFYGSAASSITTFSTGTNALYVTNCSFNTCVTVLNLLVGGNNIVVQNCDIEGCGIAMGMANYTSVKIDGNYIENGTSVAFLFSGSNFEVDITQNWLGQNAVPTPISNVVGGRFSGNTVYQSTWTTASLQDFFIGRNRLLTGAVVPSTPWTTPTFINGFSNTGGTTVAAGYIRESNGLVRLRGTVQAGADNVAFVLPVGYRPSGLQKFAGMAANNTFAHVDVDAAGAVSVYRGTDQTCDLAGVCFQALS